MVLNIIGGDRPGRTKNLMYEIDRCGIENYKLWPPIKLPSIKESINKAHRQIVEWAYNEGVEEILIAEDDFKSTHQDSFRFFLSKKPEFYDIYLGGIFLGDLDECDKVKSFTGLTMYFVHSRYFETFISIPGIDHIDHELSKEGGEFIVCNPFPFTQYSGISSNTGKFEDYNELFKFRNLFIGEI